MSEELTIGKDYIVNLGTLQGTTDNSCIFKNNYSVFRPKTD